MSEPSTALAPLDEALLLPPTHRQFEAFQKAYCYFNEMLFAGSLKHCILIFSGRSPTGYFTPNRWVSEKDEKIHEIGLNPALLDTAALQDVMAVLVHNMTHQWQWEQGEQIDRRKAYVHYHNKEWSMKLASLGLAPSDTGEEDGKMTGFIMSQYVVDGGDFLDAFEAMPSEASLPYKAKKLPFKSKQTSVKLAYTCTNLDCSKKVWGAPNIQIRCGCGKGDYDFLPEAS